LVDRFTRRRRNRHDKSQDCGRAAPEALLAVTEGTGGVLARRRAMALARIGVLI